MATKQVLTFPRDVLPRYFVGGLWRSADANKRPSRTTSSRGKLRIVTPPPEGWKGGLPEQNGWKPRSGK